jgi:hypothetical protein
MKKFFLSLFVFICAMDAFAVPSEPVVFEIIKTRGEVLYGGKQVTEGQKLDQTGILETSDRSYVILTFNNGKGKLTLAPSSSLDLKVVALAKGSMGHAVTLLRGAVRWVGSKEAKLSGLMTNQAGLSVRGTDFLLKTNPLLDETETVVFEGKVMFENLANPYNKSMVRPGQWGGIGGRFGQTIGKIIDLPKEALVHFDRQLKIP